MATQDRQDFLWRPNDNSITTRTRYDLEAEHWVRAFKSAKRKHKPRNIKDDLSIIGLIFQVVFSLLGLMILLIIELVKWIKSQ
ncbi:hypothetical protein [uncultured Winogradskyella sp.]|uniref:hypothetical protein n=1 Tax=uncultured Winogradskyella sp. TaxID=395353 RepID=UPI00263A16F1|nr:hypothetical protein [uncultured Winogradskyella sp.]